MFIVVDMVRFDEASERWAIDSGSNPDQQLDIYCQHPSVGIAAYGTIRKI